MVINDQLIKMLHFSKEIKNMLNTETNYISEWFIKLEAQVSLYRSPDINKSS